MNTIKHITWNMCQMMVFDLLMLDAMEIIMIEDIILTG